MRDERGGIPAGGWIAILAIVAILVGVVFAVTRGSSSGGSAGNNSPSSTSSGRSASTANLSFKPVDGCTLLTAADLQPLLNSQGNDGALVAAPRSSYSSNQVETLATPGPGWVTPCQWAGAMKVPKGDPEACFWGGDNEPGVTINLLQQVDANEAAAITYMRNTSGAALTPDHALDGDNVGNGAAGTLTVETAFLRWSPPGAPTLPPKACTMGGGPNATLSVLVGGSRLGSGITATLTLRVYSQWDEMWGGSPPLTALETALQRALSRLPT